MESTICKQLAIIKERMEAACLRAGRRVDEVQLIAVSKTIDVERVQEAVDCGVDLLGENKPQEIRDKSDRITGDVKWHLIGHLQRNKVKYVIDRASLIHTVDSERLADEINKRAEALSKTMEVLVQINIGDEDQKSGIDPTELITLLDYMSHLDYIKVVGLMAIAPFDENPEAARPFFKKMKTLFEWAKELDYNNVRMQHLSMGMTQDFEIAIEEGATMIRVGTGIFGSR